MPSVFITGANRGLGLEWVRQYAVAGWRVHASCRHPETAHELSALAAGYASLCVHRLDVTDAAQVRMLRLDPEQSAIDILVNNAGVYLDKFSGELGRLDFDAWRRTFEVNTLGAARVTEALSDRLAKSEKKLVVAITSQMGSIAEIASAGRYAYRASKAALNAVMKGLSLELKERGIGVLLLHPGWVETRMGGPSAPLTPEESVRGMRALVENFTPGMSGRFFRYNGIEIPW
jgi:NAD(P)-dependent dehydrogenase (short-subunit alcohol dehydrogenase family)